MNAIGGTARLPGGHPGDRVGVRVGSFDWSVLRSRLVPPTEMALEHLRCLAPRDADRVLTAMYGDYRRLPPEHEQTSEHAFTAAWRQPYDGDPSVA